MRPTHLIVSILIVAVLGLQVYAFFGKDQTAFPFLDYPMYNRASGPPVQTVTRELFAELPDGRRVEVDPAYMGVAFWAWRFHLVERVLARPKPGQEQSQVALDHVEAIGRVVDQIRRREGARPAALIVESITHRLEGGRIVQYPSTDRVDLHPEEARP